MDGALREPSAPLEVILAGAGKRAREWAALLARSRIARLVALVARDEAARVPGLDAPRFLALDDALTAFPEARVAAALPPRASLQVALALVAAGRRGLVQAPVHPDLARIDVPAGGPVQVAHGWVTLPGRVWIARALARRVAERVTIEARGLPEEHGGDPEEVMLHALALVARLTPSARVEAAMHPRDTRIEVTLRAADGAVFRVIAHADGHDLELRAEGASFDIAWLARDSEETLRSRVRGARVESRSRAIPPASVRALHQLVDPAQAGGDDLARARTVAQLALDVRSALGRRVTLGGRSLRDAARIARARPRDLLAQLGLMGELPDVEPAPRLHVPAPAEPLELWPFRAGVKPVAFLTVLPGDADRTAACFDGAHVERRERRVHAGPQDAWIDRRDLGEPRVELYISRDPALAAEAARLQAEGDPSASLHELGRLMGYPPCCIEAFAAQDDRANNTRNRYATAARTDAAAWPWELNNLHTMLIPCYPCSYTCPAALTLARSALRALDAAHLGATTSVRALLARPVLYFDHDHQIVLQGHATHERARYSGASVLAGGPELSALAGAIGAGDELELTDGHLSVRAEGREILRLLRTDPGLGFLAPFGLP